MPLKAAVNSLDGLSDDIKKLYKQEGKVFLLDVEDTDGFSLQNVTALKATLSKERSKAESLAEQLKAFEGIDIESAKKALDLQKELDGKPLDKALEERVKIREQALTEKFTKDVNALREENSTLMKSLEGELVTGGITRALAPRTKHGDVLLPHLRDNVRVRKVDGRYILQVVDSDGKTPRLSAKSGSTESMTLDELVDTFSKSEKFAMLFDSNAKGGSGPTNGKGKAGGPFTITEAEAINPRAYRAAKEAAAKAGAELRIV